MLKRLLRTLFPRSAGRRSRHTIRRLLNRLTIRIVRELRGPNAWQQGNGHFPIGELVPVRVLRDRPGRLRR